MRPRWSTVWMEVAWIVSRRSLCSRAQVGCVIVDEHNRVESVSYNGPAPKFHHGGKTCESWCPRAPGEGAAFTIHLPAAE